LGNKSKQLTLKILINGGYGVFGDNRYDYYDPRVAELVTALGRQALSKMQRIAKDLGFKIIYGHTDSLILDNPDVESLSKFQDRFNKELDIELGIKNTYFNCILSKGKKHYIGYGLNDKNKETFDVVGMEGKKSDRPQFVNNAFKQLVNDVVRYNIEPIPHLRCAMYDLDSNKIVEANLLKISKLLGDNPEDYKSQTCQSATICKALGKSKGELIEYFVSNLKKTGSRWSTNPSDIDTKWYKQSLWNTVSEVLQIAGYSTEILAKEFGVTNPNKKSKSTNGHSDAEPPCE
jgi:DNA polymerase I